MNLSKKWIDKIQKEWNAKIPHVQINKSPELIHVDKGMLMSKLIYEEYTELKKSIEENDIVEIADAVGDMLYLIYGTASQYGFQKIWQTSNPDPINTIEQEINELMRCIRGSALYGVLESLRTLEFLAKKEATIAGIHHEIDNILTEIHSSKLSKLTDGKLKLRDDGKILKPDTFVAPDLTFLLQDHI